MGREEVLSVEGGLIGNVCFCNYAKAGSFKRNEENDIYSYIILTTKNIINWVILHPGWNCSYTTNLNIIKKC